MSTYAITGSDARSRREQYERTRAALWMEKMTFDPTWRELADFVKPRRLRAFVTDRNKGDRRNRLIIDSAGTFAHRTLQSGLHAGMTSPARPWFNLSTPDEDLANHPSVKKWLYDVTGILLSKFQKSNVYTALPTIYGDMGLFATAACGIMEDPRQTFRCYPYPLGTYALGISNRQMVDTFIREYQMTVGQLIGEFGLQSDGKLNRDVFSQSVLNMWDQGQYQQIVNVCWMVAPNPDQNPSKLDPKYLPFYSCHFELASDADRMLRESGFREFPILAPRWEVQAEDIYGTDCPAITALGDIRGLQTMAKKKAQAVEKMINPPLQAPTSVRPNGVTVLPGGVNYVDVNQLQHGIRPIHEVNLPINDVRLDIQDVRELIRRAFYEDLFMMLTSSDRPEMTAREVQERHEEKLLGLGPVLERTQDECLEPMIDRTYAMAERKGEIPDAPPELNEVPLKIEYTSILAQAQKLVGVVGLDRFVQTTITLSNIFPQVRHKVKVFEIINQYADVLSIDPDLIVPDDEADAAWQQEQAAAAAQQRAQLAATAAKSMRDMSGVVPPGPGSTVDDQALREAMTQSV